MPPINFPGSRPTGGTDPSRRRATSGNDGTGSPPPASRQRATPSGMPEGAPLRLRGGADNCAFGNLRQATGEKLKAAGKAVTPSYDKGFGYQGYTLSSPLGSWTQTAKSKQATKVRTDGTAPAIPAVIARAQPPDTAPVQAPRHGAAEPLHAATASHEAIDTLFAGATNGDRQALKTATDGLKAAAAPFALSHGEAALLVKSLADSFGRGGIVRATAALQALGQTDIAGTLHDPMNAPHPASAALKDAWKLAADLEATKEGGVGFDLLDKVSAHAGGARFDRDQEAAVRGYLVAARQVGVESRNAAPDFDPGSVYRQGRVDRAIRRAERNHTWPGRNGAAVSERLTLAEKALLAARDEFDRPPGVGVHGCRFAVHMMGAGMVDERAGSEYQQCESRTHKTVNTQLNRVLRQDKGLVAALKKTMVLQDKSSFYAYDAISSTDGRGRGFSLPHRNAIHEGRHIKAMMETVEAALARTGGPHGGALPTAAAPIPEAQLHPVLIDNLARHALLGKAKTEFVPRLTRADDVAETYLDGLAAGMAARIAPPHSAQLQARLRAALEQQNQHFTPDALQAWLGDTAPTQAEQARFDDAHAFATTPGRTDFEARPLQGMTRAEAADLIAEMIRHEELGSGFSFSNGGTIGANTKLASAIASGVFSGGSVIVRANAGGGGARVVGLESGVSTDRSALRMSVTKLKRGEVGGGASAGLAIGDTTGSGSVGGDLTYTYEFQEQEGVAFGFPRHLHGGVGGDPATSEKKARLFKLLVNVPDHDGGAYTACGNASDNASALKRAYQEFGSDLSIGRYTVRQTDHRVTGSASAGIGTTEAHDPGDHPHFKAALSAGGAIQWKGGTITYQDHSGALRVSKTVSSNTWKGSASGILASVTGLIDTPARGEALDPAHPDTLTPTHDHPSVQAGVGLPLASMQADVYRAGTADTHVSISYHGKLLDTSFKTTTFQKTGAFNKAVAADTAFAEQKARKYRADQFGPGTTEAQQRAAVDRERQAMGEFAGRLSAEKDNTATPQMYWEWAKSHVDDSNLLRADAALSARLGEGRRAEAAKEAIEDIRTGREYLEGRFLINLNTESQGRKLGLDLMGTGATKDSGVKMTSLDFV